MKEKRARCKAEHSDDKRHDITEEPVSVTHTVECSGDIPNEWLCDDFTEPEVASSTVCDHYPELCDVTEYVVSSAADGADIILFFLIPQNVMIGLCGNITHQSCVM